MNDIQRITTELERKKAGMDRAIVALREFAGAGAMETKSPAAPVRKKRRISAAGRKRMADAARRRWAVLKGETSAPAGGAKKAAAKTKSAGRKKRRVRKAKATEGLGQ